MPTIRPATVEDAEAIAEVHVDGWRWGYAGLLPDHVLEALDVGERQAWWAAWLARRRSLGEGCLVADRGGDVLGFVGFGPASDEYGEPPPDAGEVYSIYVRRGIEGTGVADELFSAAQRELIDGGFARAILWVLESNARARRFYGRDGWRPDGARGHQRFGDRTFPVVRYAIRFAQRPAGG